MCPACTGSRGTIFPGIPFLFKEAMPGSHSQQLFIDLCRTAVLLDETSLEENLWQSPLPLAHLRNERGQMPAAGSYTSTCLPACWGGSGSQHHPGLFMEAQASRAKSWPAPSSPLVSLLLPAVTGALLSSFRWRQTWLSKDWVSEQGTKQAGF